MLINLPRLTSRFSSAKQKNKKNHGHRTNLTVAIMSYKYGHLAAHCIESIQSQSQPPENILFVDDGGGDCAHLPTLYPSVDFILRPQNLGIVENFQDILMNKITTERVLFIGADNWLSSDAIQEISQAANKADIITYDLLVTGNQKDEILNRHPKEVHASRGDWYWDRSSGHHGSMMYRVDKAREVGGYAHSGRNRSEEDQVLYRRMINAGATRKHIAKALLYYRRHEHNFHQ